MPISLLLFVDERPRSSENIEQIRACLANIGKQDEFNLETIKITEQPQLLELYKLVATPALVKIFPEPKQTLAGSNLVEKLIEWWPHWQDELKNWQRYAPKSPTPREVQAVSGPYAESNSPSHQSDSSQKRRGELDEVEAGSALEGRNTYDFSTPGYAAELIQLSDEIFSLKRETEQLKQQLQFKDQILAMLAHDLRSPLTAASIAAETIELSDNSNNQNAIKLKKQLIAHLKKQFQIMNRMVADLLEASKSIHSRLQIQPCQLQLQDLCYDIIYQIKDKIESKSQQLTADIPQDLPSVYADEELIRQVIINLLENAVKYTPSGGQINLSVLHRTSQKIQVSVCDTGLGIPPEKQESIFEGHFRLKRDEAQEGYGLGLSLCRKIIRAHYGQIWVNSSDSGSCFYFTLPVCQAGSFNS